MSGYEPFPPPGPSAPPPPGPPPWPQPSSTNVGPGLPGAYPGPHPGGPPVGQPGVPPIGHPGGFRGAAHKPGALPLRPLTLGDIYDAALKVIRFNPKATVGSAVLVTAIAMALPVLLTTVLTFGMDLSLDPQTTDFSTSEVVGLVTSFGSLLLGIVLQGIGLVLVTGMVAHVVAAAAIGQRLTLGAAWARTHGKRWRLIGLTMLIGLLTLMLVALYALVWIPVVMTSDAVSILVFAVVTVPLFLAGMSLFWVRVYYLPVPALMLEPVGVLGAIGRGFRLTRGAFWRTFGIALLTVLVTQVAGGMLSAPISIVGQLAAAAGASAGYGALILVLTQALSSVITAAFVAPFTSAVTSIQYLDQRMRKEAYDVELMSMAGITGQ